MTTTFETPLGRVEDQHLELKAKKALKTPETVAREVVAMLNADGGEIWIGLREENGRAMEIEPINDAGSAKERLWDHLVDSLEPALRHDEVRIEVVDLPSGGMEGAQLLRIDVAPVAGRRPYALLKGSAWQFPLRVGARLRPMTREEIVGSSEGEVAPSDGPAAELGGARSALLEWRNQERESRSGLWLGVVTVPDLDLDPQSPLFEQLAFEPSASGNRTTGWSFVRTQHRPAVHVNRVQWGGTSDDYAIDVEIFDNGRAKFFASFGALAWKNEDIWPLSLLEYPISAVRILGKIYQGLDQRGLRIIADLALFNVADRGLKPGSPGSFRFGTQRPRRLTDGPDLLVERPLDFSRDEVVGEPDRCGFRLLRRVYQAFGLREKDIPSEYDRESGRLILPE